MTSLGQYAPRRLSMAWVAMTALALAGLGGCATAPPDPNERPAALTTQYVQVGEQSLAYYEMGQGPAVVIIHGVGGRKEDWRGVAAALSGDHRVFAVDMLGFGESSKSGEDLAMPVQAAAIRALLDAHGVARADIVGNSVGGWVATTFAATYPEATDRLAIIDVAGFEAMFQGAPPVNFDPSTVEEMDALLRFLINSEVVETPGFAARALDAYVASGEKAVAPVWGRSLYASPRLEALLPRVQAPTLVLWGADDRLFPAALCGVFAGQIAGARCQLIPDAGHFPNIDNESATIEALSAFLNR